MKIISCGCSFMTIDNTAPGTHLSEIVAKHFSAELESYAKMGSSNFAVRLQIEEAITQRPDLILIGFTSADRIDIPINNNQYCIPNGIRNIEYASNHILPKFYNANAITTLSNPIHLFEQNKELESPIKSFIINIYDIELKRHQDFFIASGILDKLIKYKIPFIFTKGGLTGPDWGEWINYEVNNVNGNPWLYVGIPGGIYHTTFAKQQELSQEWIRMSELCINKI